MAPALRQHWLESVFPLQNGFYMDFTHGFYNIQIPKPREGFHYSWHMLGVSEYIRKLKKEEEETAQQNSNENKATTHCCKLIPKQFDHLFKILMPIQLKSSQ